MFKSLIDWGRIRRRGKGGGEDGGECFVEGSSIEKYRDILSEAKLI